MNVFRILLKEALVLLVLFDLGRVLFLLGYGGFDSSGEALGVFRHSLRLDLATIAECLALFYLSMLFSPVLKGKITFLAGKYLSILLALAISLIFAGEMVTYDEWGTKLNYKVFIHLTHPAEIINTGGTLKMLVFTLVTAILMGAYILMRRSRFLGFRQLRESLIINPKGRLNLTLSALSYLLLAPVLVIVMRGGLQPIPVNQSSSYFSDTMKYNDAAVNPLWNLGFSLTENYANFDNSNPFKFREDDVAQAIVDRIYEPAPSPFPADSVPMHGETGLFRIKRPNIVLLILESWSANVVSCMNGPASVTPHFDKLVKDGLLFTSFYASGYTSDLAMPAIFSSFHALPVASIVTQPSKVKHLPGLSGKLSGEGYRTSFLFGGQLSYGNIKSYLLQQGFDQITEEDDLDRRLPRGKLGIHDEYIFRIHRKELGNMPEDRPFFAALFSLSSHAPYDMPLRGTRQYDREFNEYLNSVHYTDSCLGVYFSGMEEQSFYENTIFIITGDHGHYAPASGDKFSKQFNNIPLLIYGRPLRDSLKGRQMEGVCSQVDLAPTLLHQLGIPAGEFIWGKDMLDVNAPEFAYYSGPNSISWIRPYGYFAYENRFKKYMHLELQYPSRADELIEEGRAYGQMVFQDYLDY